MKRIFIEIGSLSWIFALAVVAEANPQNTPWDTSTIGPDSFGVLCIDVQRVLAFGSNTGDRQRLVEHLKQDRKTDPAEIDHLQAIFGGKGSSPGPDDVTHVKLVFLKPAQIDAESIGGMTGYSLVQKNHQDRTFFADSAGRRSGAWGGFPVDDKTCVFAVERKMIELLDSQAESGKLAEALKRVSGRHDIYVRFLGGDRAAAMAEDLWWPGELIDLVRNATEGEITINFGQEMVLSVKIQLADQDLAAGTAAALEMAVTDAASFIEQTYGQDYRDRIGQMQKIGGIPESTIAEMQNEADTMMSFGAMLENMKVDSDGATVGIRYSKPGGAPELLNSVVQLYIDNQPGGRGR